MTMKSPPVWKDALAVVSARLVLSQLGLVAGVFGFFLLWLRMPDASVVRHTEGLLLSAV